MPLRHTHQQNRHNAENKSDDLKHRNGLPVYNRTEQCRNNHTRMDSSACDHQRKAGNNGTQGVKNPSFETNRIHALRTFCCHKKQSAQRLSKQRWALRIMIPESLSDTAPVEQLLCIYFLLKDPSSFRLSSIFPAALQFPVRQFHAGFPNNRAMPPQRPP